MGGKYATVEVVSPGKSKVVSVLPPLRTCTQPSGFLKVLWKWGNTWIWEELKVQGGTKWVAQDVYNGSLLAVTDG